MPTVSSDVSFWKKRQCTRHNGLNELGKNMLLCWGRLAFWTSGVRHCLPGFAAAWPLGALSLSWKSGGYFQKFCRVLSNLAWSYGWWLSTQRSALLRMLAIDRCRLIWCFYRSGILVGRDKWFCCLAERKLMEAIFKGWSRGLAEDLAPAFGPALGRRSWSFSETGVMWWSNNTPARRLLGSWNHSCNHGARKRRNT